MPGLRLSAGRRGLRAGIGPRAARIHVGSGRTGVSTGVGPLTMWAPLGGSSGRRAGHTSLASYERQVRAAERQQAQEEKRREIAELGRLIESMRSVHREEFGSAVRPVVPSPSVPAEEISASLRAAAETRLGRRWRRASDATKALVEDAIVLEIGRRRAIARGEQVVAQAAADAAFDQLVRNDPASVVAALDAAYEDNGCPSAPIDVDGDEATVLMLLGHPSEMPDRHPSVTPVGKPTLRRWNHTEAA